MVAYSIDRLEEWRASARLPSGGDGVAAQETRERAADLARKLKRRGLAMRAAEVRPSGEGGSEGKGREEAKGGRGRGGRQHHAGNLCRESLVLEREAASARAGQPPHPSSHLKLNAVA